MPPKKGEDEVAQVPYTYMTVLPIVVDSHAAETALRQNVNLKKNIDRGRAMELLREKGIDKYLVDNKLTNEGVEFVCENLTLLCTELSTQLKKPVEVKKEQKNPTKEAKDAKKDEPVDVSSKPIEFNYEKGCTEFYFLLDYPKTYNQLQKVIKSGTTIDIILLIHETIKESSKFIDYSLLNQRHTLDHYLSSLNTPQQQTNIIQTILSNHIEEEELRQMIKLWQLYRMSSDNEEVGLSVIIELPFVKDLEHPEEDGKEFLKILFEKVCELSIMRGKYLAWKKMQKVKSMVRPIKEVRKKEIQIEEKKDDKDKKGGKKEPVQIQTEIVEEVVDKRYEDVPEHVKSDLKEFWRIDKLRQPGKNIYKDVLESIISAIDCEPVKSEQQQGRELIRAAQLTKQKLDNRPLNKVTLTSLQHSLRPVLYPNCDSLLFRPNIKPTETITEDITLSNLLNYLPCNKSSLHYEFYMYQFSQLMSRSESRLSWSFTDRHYLEHLTADQLSSTINNALEYDPQILSSNLVSEHSKLIILSRMNPPGRLLYNNYIFDWKVLPNYQFWLEGKVKDEKNEWYDYSWKSGGNLTIRNTRMMPADNVIINDGVYTVGEKEFAVIWLEKDGTMFGIKEERKRKRNVFWRASKDVAMEVFTDNVEIDEEKVIEQEMNEHGKEQEGNKKDELNIGVCIRQKEYVVIFNPNPTIFWLCANSLELKRYFAARGAIIRYMRNNDRIIYYPNGNISTFSVDRWRHVRNHEQFEGELSLGHLQFTSKIEGNKTIKIRSDQTIFISTTKELTVIFNDGTQIHHNLQDNKLSILNKENIVIRIQLPRIKDFNVIGYGSAFAYLGYKNVLERSYDGYLFELFSPIFSSHYYIEKYEQEGKIITSGVRLLTIADGSLIRVLSNGHITYQGENRLSKEEILRERWLQLFTEQKYHNEGVFDIYLQEGWLQTTDHEHNSFKLYGIFYDNLVDGRTKIDVAVSFNIMGENVEKNNYPNGFHVPEQNYFLPAPENCVPMRLFVVREDGTGMEFMNEGLLYGLVGWNEEIVKMKEKVIKQYTKLVSAREKNKVAGFTKEIEWQCFKLPGCMQSNEKRIYLIEGTFEGVMFREIEEVDWNREYANVKMRMEEIRKNKEQRNAELTRLRTGFVVQELVK